MKLSTKAIVAMKGNPRVKNRLALEMDTSVQTIERWIKENTSNGRLTTVRAVQIISEETKLSEAKVLDTSSVNEPQI